MKYYYIQLDEGKTGKYIDYLKILATFESSSDGYQCVNIWNYLGKYQIGDTTLSGTGYYTTNKETYRKKIGDDEYNIFKWTGNWEKQKNLSIKNIYQFLGIKENCKKNAEGFIPDPYIKENKKIIDESIIDKTI